MRKLGLLAAAIFTIPTTVWAQSMCTDANSPRECYEAGLKMMAEAMGKMEALKLEYDAKLSDIRKELTLPPGTVLAFSAACPSGWTKLPGGNGRYIRVSDDSPLQSGGVGEFFITADAIPRLRLNFGLNYGRDDYTLWGISGPRGEGKQVSFSGRDAGHSGAGNYPLANLTVGQDSPTAIKVEPPFISLTFCQNGG